jgi:hypothetical protein
MVVGALEARINVCCVFPKLHVVSSILFYRHIVCRLFFSSVSVSQYTYNSKITTHFLQLLHVLATIFGHHQVLLIQPLSTLFAIPPHPLANVSNWGKVILLLTVVDLYTVNHTNLCLSVVKGMCYSQYKRCF